MAVLCPVTPAHAVGEPLQNVTPAVESPRLLLMNAQGVFNQTCCGAVQGTHPGNLHAEPWFEILEVGSCTSRTPLIFYVERGSSTSIVLILFVAR